jgi:hypothetical protein
VGVERRWFPRKQKLLPTLRVRIVNLRPREDWIVYVHADRGTLVSRWDNLAFAPGRGVGRVFNPNPVVALGDHRPLLHGDDPADPPARTYRRVALRDLTSGHRLDGKRVSTRLTPGRVRHAERQYLFRRGARGFDETMVYHHVDAAIRYLESLGFTGSRRIFREPIPVNAHATYRAAVMSWDAITYPDFDPPCLRRLDEPLGYDDFEADGDEHDNGCIWSATLWDVFTKLGRRIADTLIVESHFQLDGFTTFARGARAIVDADQNLYGGRHTAELRRIFRRRKLEL